MTGTELPDPGSLHSPMHFSLCSPSQPITPSSLGGLQEKQGQGWDPCTEPGAEHPTLQPGEGNPI